ncbi:Alpha/Beta hydrolase protein [Aspergillus varians]
MSLLKRILSLPKEHPRPTASALRASSTLPTSRSTSATNSQGASQAVADLSETLGPALNQIDLDGEPKAQIGLFLDQLDTEASKYENAQLDCRLYPEWDCSEANAQLISTAFQGAQSVYDLPDNNNSTSIGPAGTVQSHTVPSIGGTVKASTFTRVSDEHGPVLVIAIRGSASVVDHVVNANYRPADASNFIDFTRWYKPGGTFSAHAGFLKSAEVLEPTVSREINKYVGEFGEKSRVLFTGHSAGGAVASLLFLRYIYSQHSVAHTHWQLIRFSCITFGAPPVLTVPAHIDERYLCLNVINEFDMVSRADGAYKDCLVDLVRSMHESGEQSAATKTKRTPDAGPDTETSSRESHSQQEKVRWPTPKSCYSHVGPRIVCAMRPDATTPASLRLHVVEVPKEDFERLLFCRVSVHRRACYAQRVRLLVEGRVNEAAKVKA